MKNPKLVYMIYAVYGNGLHTTNNKGYESRGEAMAKAKEMSGGAPLKHGVFTRMEAGEAVKYSVHSIEIVKKGVNKKLALASLSQSEWDPNDT
jgi:hypothetical protein